MMIPRGYVARRPVPDDAAAIAAMIGDFDDTMFGERDASTEDVLFDFSRPRFDPNTDAWLVMSSDQTPAAYGTVWMAAAESGDIHVDGFVHPKHAGMGLGAWLAHAMEARAREIGGSTLRTVVAGPDAAAQSLFASRGWKEVRRDWKMCMDLDRSREGLRLPAGISIGGFRWDRDAVEAHAVLMESFRDHRHFAFRDFEEWTGVVTAHPNHDPRLWRVARDESKIAGVLVALESAGVGWVWSLGVLASHRGRGIAGALLHEAFAMFASRGLSQVCLHVDSENSTGATRVYERAGMRVAREYVFFELRTP